jgi:hypothetical protein
MLVGMRIEKVNKMELMKKETKHNKSYILFGLGGNR